MGPGGDENPLPELVALLLGQESPFLDVATLVLVVLAAGAVAVVVALWRGWE